MLRVRQTTHFLRYVLLKNLPNRVLRQFFIVCANTLSAILVILGRIVHVDKQVLTYKNHSSWCHIFLVVSSDYI